MASKSFPSTSYMAMTRTAFKPKAIGSSFTCIWPMAQLFLAISNAFSLMGPKSTSGDSGISLNVIIALAIVQYHQFGPEKLQPGQVYLTALLRQPAQRTMSYWLHFGHLKVTVPRSFTVFFLQELQVLESIF